MYYHFKDHIYIAQYRDEFILLDTKKDQYRICIQQFSEVLSNFFEKNTTHAGQPELTYLQELLNDSIIERKNFPYPYFIDQKLKTNGVANVDWRLPLDNKKTKFNGACIEAFLTLVKINCYLKLIGFYETVQLIKRYRNPRLQYVIPQAYELRSLANIVNKACFLYPTRTKCLEWAMTYTLLALKRKWKCNLEIGVQNYPFFAHAWVECDGEVVMDSQELRKGMAIILSEPFRKLKQ